MAKFAGLVGYASQVETSPGIWEVDERTLVMKGDLIRQNADSSENGKVNGDIALGHRLSLIGDAYAFDNYYNLKWVMIDGRKWTVSSVEIQRPRLIIGIGGLYNE